MTRDDATSKLYQQLLYMQPVNSRNWCAALVSGLIELGVLRVDLDPASPLEAVALSLSKATLYGPLTAAKVVSYLDAEGFKVVKK
jgi:hypothetical protein